MDDSQVVAQVGEGLYESSPADEVKPRQTVQKYLRAPGLGLVRQRFSRVSHVQISKSCLKAWAPEALTHRACPILVQLEVDEVLLPDVYPAVVHNKVHYGYLVHELSCRQKLYSYYVRGWKEPRDKGALVLVASSQDNTRLPLPDVSGIATPPLASSESSPTATRSNSPSPAYRIRAKRARTAGGRLLTETLQAITDEQLDSPYGSEYVDQGDHSALPLLAAAALEAAAMDAAAHEDNQGKAASRSESDDTSSGQLALGLGRSSSRPVFADVRSGLDKPGLLQQRRTAGKIQISKPLLSSSLLVPAGGGRQSKPGSSNSSPRDKLQCPDFASTAKEPGPWVLQQQGGLDQPTTGSAPGMLHVRPNCLKHFTQAGSYPAVTLDRKEVKSATHLMTSPAETGQRTNLQVPQTRHCLSDHYRQHLQNFHEESQHYGQPGLHEHRSDSEASGGLVHLHTKVRELETTVHAPAYRYEHPKPQTRILRPSEGLAFAAEPALHASTISPRAPEHRTGLVLDLRPARKPMPSSWNGVTTTDVPERRILQGTTDRYSDRYVGFGLHNGDRHQPPCHSLTLNLGRVSSSPGHNDLDVSRANINVGKNPATRTYATASLERGQRPLAAVPGLAMHLCQPRHQAQQQLQLANHSGYNDFASTLGTAMSQYGLPHSKMTIIFHD